MLYVMCGLPASGKTTLARQIEVEKHCVRYSFDEFEGSNTPVVWKESFKLFCQNISDDLSHGKDVVCDALLTDVERRQKLLSSLEGVKCDKTIIVVNTDFEECLKRNEQRGDCKTDTLMMKVLYLTFQTPTLDEGWDEIIYYKGE